MLVDSMTVKMNTYINRIYLQMSVTYEDGSFQCRHIYGVGETSLRNVLFTLYNNLTVNRNSHF